MALAADTVPVQARRGIARATRHREDNARETMLIGTWRPERICSPEAFATHLHGRDLEVLADATGHDWRWRVTTPHGVVLAEGHASTRALAEQAAEDEATAIHPPTEVLLDVLLR